MKTRESESLEAYISVEGTEVSNYCRALCEMRQMSEDYGMTKVFSIALNVEIRRKLEWLKANATIVTKRDTVTREWQELEWRNE